MKNDSKTLVVKSIKPLQKGKIAIYFYGEKKPYETEKRNYPNIAPEMSVTFKKGKLLLKT